jgi:hypothetical protein
LKQRRDKQIKEINESGFMEWKQYENVFKSELMKQQI